MPTGYKASVGDSTSTGNNATSITGLLVFDAKGQLLLDSVTQSSIPASSLLRTRRYEYGTNLITCRTLYSAYSYDKYNSLDSFTLDADKNVVRRTQGTIGADGNNYTLSLIEVNTFEKISNPFYVTSAKYTNIIENVYPPSAFLLTSASYENYVDGNLSNTGGESLTNTVDADGYLSTTKISSSFLPGLVVYNYY